jgi:signal transduction histidine kinase
MTAKIENERDLPAFVKEDVERERHELAMLYQISQFMQGTLDLNEILHSLLTALTSGCALGFSRAMILGIDREKEHIIGMMGVGPANHEEAYRIWSSLEKEHTSLPNFLKKFGRKISDADQYFDSLVKDIHVPLDMLEPEINEIIAAKSPSVMNSEVSGRVPWLSRLGVTDYVAVPLIAGEDVVGIVFADNYFNPREIDGHMIRTLSLFATQAGVAYERARAVKQLEEEKGRLQSTLIELKETQDQLIHVDRLATLGTMAAQIAHEVKNPLTAIGGFARTLLKHYNTCDCDEKLKDYAGIIVEEVTRLESFIANVLDFSRISSAAVCLENINQVIEDTCAFFDLQADKASKNIKLIKKLDPSVRTTLMDPRQIKQVLLNVCQNAIQAMESGGELFVTTKQVTDEQIRIEVTDSGRGMTGDELVNIFDPFFTTKSAGSGLGLPISQQIILNHGGYISLSSTPGEGTTVCIDLQVMEDLDRFYENMEKGLAGHMHAKENTGS